MKTPEVTPEMVIKDSRPSKDKLVELFSCQDKLNQKIHPKWELQHFNWWLATKMELAELIDSTNWKWWKGGTYGKELSKEQVDNIKVELVDVFHFLLSDYLQTEATGHKRPASYEIWYENAADSLQLNWHYLVPMVPPSSNWATNALSATSNSDVLAFMEVLMGEIQFDWEDLTNLYWGKVALNKLRQDNGYNEGTYNKVWRGKEDNVYMTYVIEKLFERGEAISITSVYNELRVAYKRYGPKEDKDV